MFPLMYKFLGMALILGALPAVAAENPCARDRADPALMNCKVGGLANVEKGLWIYWDEAGQGHAADGNLQFCYDDGNQRVLVGELQNENWSATGENHFPETIVAHNTPLTDKFEMSIISFDRDNAVGKGQLRELDIPKLGSHARIKRKNLALDCIYTWGPGE